ncbi:MAG: hypothetical protein AAGA56_10465 [Myxococcota bacterium]
MRSLVCPSMAMVKWVPVALVGAVALAALTGANPPQPPAPPAPDLVASAPRLAVVAASPHGTDIFSVDDVAAVELATVRHEGDASVRATLDLVEPTQLWLNARQTRERGPGSFDFATHAVDLTTGRSRIALESVAHASRPLPSPDRGGVWIVAGSPGASRERDEFRIVHLGPHGRADEIYRTTATYLHLAAFDPTAGRIVAYRVDPEGAELVLIDPEHGHAQRVRSLLPFARDFSLDVDQRQVVFRQRHETHASRWTIESISLTDGSQTRLFEGTSFSLAPHVWPDGDVAFNPHRSGLHLLHTDADLSFQGDGVDVVRATSERWIALLHGSTGRQHGWLYDRRTQTARALKGPRGVIDVAGFLPEASR